MSVILGTFFRLIRYSLNKLFLKNINFQGFPNQKFSLTNNLPSKDFIKTFVKKKSSGIQAFIW